MLVAGPGEGLPVALGERVVDARASACRSRRSPRRRTRPGRSLQVLAAEPAEPDHRAGRRHVVAHDRDRGGIQLHHLAVEGVLVGVGHPGDAALLDDRGVPARVVLRLRSPGDVAQPDGEHHLRLVVEVAAQRRRSDPGREQHLRRAQRVGGHDHEARPHLVVAAVPAVADHHTDGAAVLHQHPAHLRLREEPGRRVVAGRATEDDVGAAPDQRAVVPDMHGQRHRPDPRSAGRPGSNSAPSRSRTTSE